MGKERKESRSKGPGFGLPPGGWCITKYQIPSTKLQTNLKFQYPMTKTVLNFETGNPPKGWESKRSADNFGHCDLPFDLAQGGESFDFAQDREPVERLVEPFDICDL